MGDSKTEFQQVETICLLMGRGYEDKSCAGNFERLDKNRDEENCDNCKIAKACRKTISLGHALSKFGHRSDPNYR